MIQQFTYLFFTLFLFNPSSLARRLIRQRNEEDVAAAAKSFDREVHQPAAPLTFISMKNRHEDLARAADTPGKDSKTLMKNSSGKSDEGGYYRTYGSDAEGEKGYLKSTYSKGDHGYKTLDTFHKQDGDKYEFERSIAYGGGASADEEGGRHRERRDARDSENEDRKFAGTITVEKRHDKDFEEKDVRKVSSRYAAAAANGENYSSDYGALYY